MDYLLARLNDITTWIGVIGFILMLLGLHTALYVLFILMIVMPQKNFSDIFSGWNKSIHQIVEEEIRK